MLPYTTYSEAGGVGKTTLASNLADAHAQHGRDVLAIDLDPQNGSLTYLLGVDTPREDGDADNIARHLIDRPKGDFHELVEETAYGFDLVPSHNMLENLGDLLGRAESMAEDLGESFSLDVGYASERTTERTVRLRCEPLVEDGETVALQGAARDVTDLKRQEQRIEILRRTSQELRSVISLGRNTGQTTGKNSAQSSLGVMPI
jgi:hypothetical protein